MTSATRVALLERAQLINQVKGYVLLGAFMAEVMAVALLAVAVSKILAVSAWPSTETAPGKLIPIASSLWLRRPSRRSGLEEPGSVLPRFFHTAQTAGASRPLDCGRRRTVVSLPL
jgi:hypothetical protein